MDLKTETILTTLRYFFVIVSQSLTVECSFWFVDGIKYQHPAVYSILYIEISYLRPAVTYNRYSTENEYLLADATLNETSS